MNHMLLCPEKTKFINFNLRRYVPLSEPIIYRCTDCILKPKRNIGNCLTGLCSMVDQTSSLKYLGIIVNHEISWKNHIENIKVKLN